MKQLFFAMVLSNFIFANIMDNSFITKFEYGEMLYTNPRGVGCVLCHEKGDKDVVLARYKEIDRKSKKLVEKSIIVPAINNVNYDVFLDKMTADKRDSKIMPTYFLTDEELKSLYYYIKNLNKK